MVQTQTLPLNTLADALGDVRAEIQSLRAREAVLRQALIDARPNGPVSGQRFEVFVRENERRVFDRDSLPGAILGDDRFWMTRTSRTVVTRPCETNRAAAAGPGRAPASTANGRRFNAQALDLWGHDSDLVLIEDF